jgi:uncharacterized protein (DUF1015 family)
MATFKPFAALRPAPEHAADVAALPYDVMSSNEARAMVQGKPYSFLRIDRAETGLAQGTDPYSDAVYEKARENLAALVSGGVLKRDGASRYYIYSLTMGGREQTGLVGCASVAEYESGVIKKHELTRPEKEADRIRHIEALDAQTGPIFLSCRAEPELTALLKEYRETHAPEYDFVAEDDIRHAVWVLPETENARIAAMFGRIPCLYIADGHHRCASACRVGNARRDAAASHSGNEEFNYFLSVVFPDNELEIMAYNRTVKDLNGLAPEEFLQALEGDFTVERSDAPVNPARKHSFGLYLEGVWYRLTAKTGGADSVSDLDVSVLQDRVLDKLLGIKDPRTDKRVEFIGGIRGLEWLKARVDAGKAAAAFSMHPTSLAELMEIADQNLLMPPKSTWFEPKLRSGLFIHEI